MKKLFLTLMGVFIMTMGTQNASAVQPGWADKKVLTVYYSYSNGNTKTIASEINKNVGGDMYEIKIDHTYPSEYTPMTEQAKEEIARGFRPALVGTLPDVSQYDVIFIGSPNWWGTIPPAVSSFLANGNLNGKRVVQFVSHGGGGQQRTGSDFASQCSGCNVDTNPWVVSGSNTSGLAEWIANIQK